MSILLRKVVLFIFECRGYIVLLLFILIMNDLFCIFFIDCLNFFIFKLFDVFLGMFVMNFERENIVIMSK